MHLRAIGLVISNHLRQKIFLICVLALFAFVYVMVFAPSKTQTIPLYDQSSQRTEQKIFSASPLSMPLHMTGGNPSALTFNFAQPEKGSPEQYTLQILDSAGKTLYTNAFTAASLEESKNCLSFSLTNIPKGGGEFTLQITTKNISDVNAVSIYTRKAGDVAVPEAEVTYALGISPWVLKLSFVTVLAGCILILFYSKKLHVNILSIVLVFGALFALLTPIMDVPDESVHASKAFLVAGGTLFNPLGGGMVSAAKEQVTNLSQFGQTIVNTTLLGAPIDPGQAQTVYGASQFFLNYIPAALIFNLFQLLHTNVLALLYGGRIANLVVYAICAFFAIKIAPRYKLFFGVVAAAPMALFIAASYNGDYLTYAFALLLAAMFARFYFQKDFTVTYKRIIWFSVVCAVICMYKIYFLPLCLLLFIIPSGRFTSRKTKWLGSLLCVGITVAATFGIAGFQQYQIGLAGGVSSVIGTDPNIMGASMNQQLHFILGNLTSSGAILLRAFVTNASNYIHQLFEFGWLSYGLPTIFVYFYVGFIALTGFIYSKYEYNMDSIAETKHTFINKLGILIILALAFAAINLVLYLIDTPVGAIFIQSVQGRYFIPLLAFLPFMSSNTSSQMDEAAYTKKQNYILFTAQVFVILSILQTLFTYY